VSEAPEGIGSRVDRAILLRLRVYAVVFAVVLVIAAAEVALRDSHPWWQAGVGLVLGVGVGILASRTVHLRWDDFEQRVVGRLDAVGVVVLLLYVVFSLTRSRLVGQWVDGDAVAPVSLSVLAGAMLGQVLGVRRGVRRLMSSLGLLEVADAAAGGAPTDR
jgi:hypothetical protein